MELASDILFVLAFYCLAVQSLQTIVVTTLTRNARAHAMKIPTVALGLATGLAIAGLIVRALG